MKKETNKSFNFVDGAIAVLSFIIGLWLVLATIGLTRIVLNTFEQKHAIAQIVVKCENNIEYYTKINKGDELMLDCSDYYYESVFDFPFVRTYRTQFKSYNFNK